MTSKTKPHEENWDCDGSTLYVAGEDGERIRWFASVEEPMHENDSWAQDRANLAKFAPVFARALLFAIEHGDMDSTVAEKIRELLKQANIIEESGK